MTCFASSGPQQATSGTGVPEPYRRLMQSEFYAVVKDKSAKGSGARHHYSQPCRKAPTGAMLQRTEVNPEEDLHLARRREADESTKANQVGRPWREAKC